MATKATQAVAPDDTPLKLKRLERVKVDVPIVGKQPLIVNRWTEKARGMMLEKQQSSTRAKKEAKDPEALFEASKYRLLDGRDGFPSSAFKAATVYGARMYEGVTMVTVKQTILICGQGRDARGDDLVALEYDECDRREDTPRNANGVADLRYRAMYSGWRAVLSVEFVAKQMSDEDVFTLVDAGGVGGVGEWRPTSPKSATGSYGTYEVREWRDAA